MQFLHADINKLINCMDVQADLSVHLVHMSENTFSHTAAQIVFVCLC